MVALHSVNLIFILILQSINIHCFELNNNGFSLASEYLTNSMNLSADPCNDFYNYACGNWAEKFRDIASSEFEKTNREISQIIDKALAKIDLTDPNVEQFKKSAKIFYEQCKNNSKEDKYVFLKQSYEYLQKKFIPNMIRSFNVSGELLPWETDKKYFWTLTGRMQRELGMSFLFEAEVLLAEEACQQVPVLHLRPTFNPKTVVDGIVLKKFLMEIVGKYHNVTFDEQDTNDTIASTMEFDKDLKHLTDQDQLFQFYFPSRQLKVKYSQLQLILPDIDWQAYFEGLLPKALRDKWIASDPIVMLDTVQYFRNVSDLITKHTQLVASNYGFLCILQKYVWFFKDAKSKTLDRKNLLDKQVYADKCQDRTVRYFSTVILRLLCEEFGLNVEEWKSDILLLKDTIFSTLKFLITNTGWLSAKEKIILINRVNQVAFYGDIPSWIMDNDMINEKTPLYNLSLPLIANDIAAQKALFMAELKPLITGTMDDVPPNFFHNAFNFVRGKGSIRYLIGWQLPPFYMTTYPMVLKYSSAGFVLAHEIMHSFGTYVYAEPENEIRRLVAPDPYNLANETLWQFAKRCRCLVPYFDEYCSVDYHRCPKTNGICFGNETCDIGNRTVEENTADAQGIKIAYYAYKLAQKTMGTEPPLSNLTQFSGDQLFFIGFTRQFCIHETKGNIFNNFFRHSTNRARIEQSLINFNTFAQAFNCSKSSRFGGRANLCKLYDST